MRQIKFVLVDPAHLSEILEQPILAVLGTERQKSFYDFVNINLKYSNVECETFASVKQNSKVAVGKIFVLMDIPATFQQMSEILKASERSEQVLVVLLKQNRKYINMFHKKVESGKYEPVQSQYSTHKFVGINQKLRELVDKSYDMNRAAFYAYGAYINTFRANLLKFIFKTEAIDVAALAKSFGFTTPPKVKDGKFLKVDAYKRKIKQKSKAKHQRRREQEQNRNQQQFKANKKVALSQKIKALAAKKTKKIIKEKQKTVQAAKVAKAIKTKSNQSNVGLSNNETAKSPKIGVKQKKQRE